jgi:hypothetical protein
MHMPDYWILSIVGLAVWLATIAAYRVFFHPLSKFPGPKLATLTTWYEAYYDVGRQGRYIFEVEKMHKIYGALNLTYSLQVHTCPIGQCCLTIWTDILA